MKFQLTVLFAAIFCPTVAGAPNEHAQANANANALRGNKNQNAPAEAVLVAPAEATSLRIESVDSLYSTTMESVTDKTLLHCFGQCIAISGSANAEIQ
jgi:hypothetical protein